MSATFHMKKDESGPARCYATVKTCPNGAFGHHKSEQDVWMAYEEAQEGRGMPSLSRKQEILRKEIADEEQNIKELLDEGHEELAYRAVSVFNKPRVKAMLASDDNIQLSYGFRKSDDPNEIVSRFADLTEEQAERHIYDIRLNEIWDEELSDNLKTIFPNNKNIQDAIKFKDANYQQQVNEANEEAKKYEIQRQKDLVNKVNVSSNSSKKKIEDSKNLRKDHLNNDDVARMSQQIAQVNFVRSSSSNRNSNTSNNSNRDRSKSIDDVVIKSSRGPRLARQNKAASIDHLTVSSTRSKARTPRMSTAFLNAPASKPKDTVSSSSNSNTSNNSSNYRATSSQNNSTSTQTPFKGRTVRNLTDPADVQANIQRAAIIKDRVIANFNKNNAELSNSLPAGHPLKGILQSAPNLEVARIANHNGLKSVTMSFGDKDLSEHKDAIESGILKDFYNDSNINYRVKLADNNKKLTLEFCSDEENSILASAAELDFHRTK